MNWLDANADGLAFMLVMGLLGCAVLLIALVIEKVHQTRRFRVDAFDARRCERAGSQGEIERRIRTAVGR